MDRDFRVKNSNQNLFKITSKSESKPQKSESKPQKSESKPQKSESKTNSYQITFTFESNFNSNVNISEKLGKNLKTRAQIFTKIMKCYSKFTKYVWNLVCESKIKFQETHLEFN